MNNCRDQNGRFQRGNPGGPGRPPIATEKRYHDTLVSVCSLDQWREICERAVCDAISGDFRARAWLSTYLVTAGVPMEPWEPPPTREEQHERYRKLAEDLGLDPDVVFGDGDGEH